MPILPNMNTFCHTILEEFLSQCNRRMESITMSLRPRVMGNINDINVTYGIFNMCCIYMCISLHVSTQSSIFYPSAIVVGDIVIAAVCPSVTLRDNLSKHGSIWIIFCMRLVIVIILDGFLHGNIWSKGFGGKFWFLVEKSPILRIVSCLRDNFRKHG